MSSTNLRTLSRYSDSLSYAYLEHAVIEQEQHSIAAFTSDGRISLPAANLSCLLLGPGTRITHAAIKVLAECGALVAWTGHDGLRFYASGQGKTVPRTRGDGPGFPFRIRFPHSPVPRTRGDGPNWVTR